MWEVETPSLGGVLLALPALLVMGLLRHTRRIYEPPKGYYGIESILLLPTLMALVEQLRYLAPGEWSSLWTAFRKCAVCARNCGGCAGRKAAPRNGARRWPRSG